MINHIHLIISTIMEEAGFISFIYLVSEIKIENMCQTLHFL